MSAEQSGRPDTMGGMSPQEYFALNGEAAFTQAAAEAYNGNGAPKALEAGPVVESREGLSPDMTANASSDAATAANAQPLAEAGLEGSKEVSDPWADLRDAQEKMNAAQERVNEEKRQIKRDRTAWNRRMGDYDARADVQAKLDANPFHNLSDDEKKALQRGDDREEMDTRAGREPATEDDIRYYRMLRDQAETSASAETEGSDESQPESFEAQLRNMTPEQLRARGLELEDNAAGLMNRARHNRAAVRRLARQLGWTSDDQQRGLEEYLNTPIQEGEPRPDERTREDRDRLRPENIDGLSEGDAQRLLFLEGQRHRFNRRDGEEALDQAEQVLREMGRREQWTDEQLNSRLEALRAAARGQNSGAEQGEGQQGQHARREPGTPAEDDPSTRGYQPRHAQGRRNGGQPGSVGNARGNQPAAVRGNDDTREHEPQHMRPRGPRQWLRDRWNGINTRIAAVGTRDWRHAFGDDPESRDGGDLMNWRRARRLAILGGTGLAAYWTATGKIDLNPWDNDISSTIDLNPLNDDNGQVPQYALGDQEAYHIFNDAEVPHETIKNMIDNPEAAARMFSDMDAFQDHMDWVNAFQANVRKDHPNIPDFILEAMTNAAAEDMYDKLERAQQQ